MGRLTDNDNIVTIKLNEELTKITKPLELLGISFFDFIRIYDNQLNISFSNDHTLIKNFFDKGFFNNSYNKSETNYFLWQHNPFELAGISSHKKKLTVVLPLPKNIAAILIFICLAPINQAVKPITFTSIIFKLLNTLSIILKRNHNLS